MASITSLWSKTVGANCAVPVKLPLAGRTDSSACCGPLGPIPGQETMCAEPAVCLSSLLAAGRHQELLEVLSLQRFPFWHDRKFGMQALLSEGRMDEALAYAETSRGLNQPEATIDAACEKILLDLGRVDEAYEKYALTANGSSTGLATFRAIVRKYPGHDPKKVLLDLATASDEPGRWFAAAKDAGFLDLALEFAKDRPHRSAHAQPRIARLPQERRPVLSGGGPARNPANPRGLRLRTDWHRCPRCLQPLHGCGADPRDRLRGARRRARHGDETARDGQRHSHSPVLGCATAT